MNLAFNTEEELKRAIEDYRRLKKKNWGTTPTDKSSEAIAGDPATVKAARKLEAHIWEREANEHYVEPEWCDRRLFEEEKFVGAIHDPSCGFGTIPKAALAMGLSATGSDLVDRGFGPVVDFMEDECERENIVCNPPFRVIEPFMIRALQNAEHKVAAIIPVARLNAAHWLRKTPLKTVWLLTPRPSMPPGHVIAAGEKPGGGRADFCWLVWERGHNGPAEVKWLRRDG